MEQGKHYEYSEPVQEIMGLIPSWLTRWGVTVIAAMLFIIVIWCCIIRYPQTITSSISIINTNPPCLLKTRQSGIIDTIAVINGQTVKKGSLIALLKTSAVYGDVLQVKSYAEMVKSSSLVENAGHPIFEKTFSLGSLQDKWEELCSLSKTYQNKYSLDFKEKKRSLLVDQIQKNKEYFDAMDRQRILIEKDIMQSDSILCEEVCPSQSDAESLQKPFIFKLNKLASINSSMKSVETNSLALEQELNELDNQIRAEDDMLNLRFSYALSELLEQIVNWIDTHVILAPFDGTVLLQESLSVGHYVNVGDVIASVSQNVAAEAVGRMKVSSVGLCQITKGQTVNVRLDEYPYIEFGTLKGIISEISKIPEIMPDGSEIYNVEVIFYDGLVTTNHKSLSLSYEMAGKAEIITEDKRLIEFLIEPMRSLFRNL